MCCARAFSANQRLPGHRLEADGIYDMDAPAGDYLAQASWEDPDTGLFLTDEKPVTLQFNETAVVDFDLQKPPASNREVIITGKMDIVSRVAFGHDWWGHPHFEMPHMHLGPYGGDSTHEPDLGRTGHTFTRQALADYGSVRVNVDAVWRADFSVEVSWNAAIFDGDDNKVSTHQEKIVIQADDAVTFVISLATSPPWPDRAHIEMTILNALQP